MEKLQFKGTQGNFTPEKEPTYNPGADAYQIAILQDNHKKDETIPGFAFGDTKEVCMANAHLFANSKLVILALSRLLALHASEDKPSPAEWHEAIEEAEHALQLSLGVYKVVNVDDLKTKVDPKTGLHLIDDTEE